MDELADSTSLLNDQGGLRRRLAGDGYLFSMDALADPAFRAAMSGAAFNRLPYLPPLRAVIRGVLGPPPGPSRLVAVHPGWRHWQPPRAVH